MEWLVLLLVAGIYCICSWLTYSEEMRNKWYFMPLAVVLGTVVSVIWFLMVKYLDDKQKIYVYSLCWDFMMMFVYYLYPVALLGVKLDKWSLVGLGMIVGGIAVIKLRST